MTLLFVIMILAACTSLILYGRTLRRPVGAVATPSARAFSKIGLPHGVFVHSGHSWVRLNGSGDMRCGIDELLAQALGGVDRVVLPKVGGHAERGAPLLTVWKGDRALQVSSPVSGTVVDVNRALQRCSMAVGNDPYGAGWLVSVLPSDQQEALRDLRVGMRAVYWLRRETDRLVGFIARHVAPGVVAVVLADGAHPVVGSAAGLGEDGWRSFEREFAGGGEVMVPFRPHVVRDAATARA